MLLSRQRDDGDACARVGFTVTKRIGGAVVRNRMKRRLRALVREVMSAAATPSTDYVLIGRDAGVERPMEALRRDLRSALARVA